MTFDENEMIDIRNYGACPGGEFDNTSAIQQALDSCAAAGGGRVRIGAGIWMSYTLYLHDNTTLHLEEGAVLLGGPDPLLYPEIADNPWWIPARCSRLNRRTLIYAEHCRNVGIAGRGTICGNAHAFTEVAMDAPQELHLVWKRKDDRKIPGRALLFVACSDVLLDEFKIENDRKNAAREKILDLLLGKAGAFDLPKSIVEGETEREFTKLANQLVRSEADVEKFKAEKEKHLEEAKRLAEEYLRKFFILRRIARDEKVEVSRAELDEQIHAMSHYMGYKEADVRKMLERNGGMAEIQADILMSKTLDAVAAAANAAS